MKLLYLILSLILLIKCIKAQDAYTLLNQNQTVEIALYNIDSASYKSIINIDNSNLYYYKGQPVSTYSLLLNTIYFIVTDVGDNVTLNLYSYSFNSLQLNKIASYQKDLQNIISLEPTINGEYLFISLYLMQNQNPSIGLLSVGIINTGQINVLNTPGGHYITSTYKPLDLSIVAIYKFNNQYTINTFSAFDGHLIQSESLTTTNKNELYLLTDCPTISSYFLIMNNDNKVPTLYTIAYNSTTPIEFKFKSNSPPMVQVLSIACDAPYNILYYSSLNSGGDYYINTIYNGIDTAQKSIPIPNMWII